MTSGFDTVATLAAAGLTIVAFTLMLFMALVQPIWCIVDCAVDNRRSGAGKAIWIVVLILLYGLANWFYGAFAAGGRWLRRLTRAAWLFAFLLLIAFFAMYSTHENFLRDIEREWQRGRELVVAAPAAAAGRHP